MMMMMIDDISAQEKKNFASLAMHVCMYLAASHCQQATQLQRP